MLIEHEFTCPYCWQRITMLLDLSVAEQNYIEDCEICCNPIQIYYRAENGEMAEFSARPIEQ